MGSPFDVLQIDADADDEEITQAYRDRVKAVHPDQGGSISEFQRVQTAYATLTAGYSVEARNSKHDDDSDQQQRTSRIEYLNYEVLDDHEWNFTDEDLFEKAAAEDLASEDYGQFLVQPHESLLEAAENQGLCGRMRVVVGPAPTVRSGLSRGTWRCQ